MKTVTQILNSASYAAKIQHPDWAKFSKTIRQHRNICECCKSDGPLQVHHLFYDPARELWEYAEEEVVVLCQPCHAAIHEQLKLFRKFVFRYLTPRTFEILNGSLAVGLTRYDPLIYMHALAEFTGNGPLVNNHARAHGCRDAKNIR